MAYFIIPMLAVSNCCINSISNHMVNPAPIQDYWYYIYGIIQILRRSYFITVQDIKKTFKSKIDKKKDKSKKTKVRKR